jgi:hypothetical protein
MARDTLAEARIHVAHHSARVAKQRRDLAPGDSEPPWPLSNRPSANTCECHCELGILHHGIALRVDVAVVPGLGPARSDPRR